MRPDRTQHPSEPTIMSPEAAARLGERMAEQLAGTLSARTEVITLSVMCLLSGGHLLLEDVPGVGKTTLARALARVARARVTRVQFTPDMLPSDLTGVNVWNPQTREFSFLPGPLFCDVLLADEINRANPKTQSALLEAMGEGRVSVDGTTYDLPDPYFVIATQNPVEMEGTYPLPEAQLDRFMVRTSLGYPAAEAERAMLAGASGVDPVSRVRPVCGLSDVRAFRELASVVHVGEKVAAYALALLDATRRSPEIRLGASPRAGLALLAISRTRALLDGRASVFPSDVRALAPAVLAHRLVLRDLSPDAGQTEQQRAALSRAIARVPAPDGKRR